MLVGLVLRLIAKNVQSAVWDEATYNIALIPVLSQPRSQTIPTSSL